MDALESLIASLMMLSVGRGQGMIAMETAYSHTEIMDIELFQSHYQTLNLLEETV